MSNPTRHPFRDLRTCQRTAQAECGLLLGLKHVSFPDMDYARFAVMSQMVMKLDNPTYAIAYAAAAAWLRFLQKLISELPEAHELRAKAQAEFDKLAAQYGDMLEVKA